MTTITANADTENTDMANTDMANTDTENTPETYDISRIKNYRSLPRTNGEISFDVEWVLGDTTREPLSNLAYTDENGDEVVNIFIKPILIDFKRTAINFPRNRRNCLFCSNKVHNGNLICNGDTEEYGWLELLN